ncbi:cytochrome C oxidase subunit IV family protein [Agarilytica rhodophyticola]|uniref:cytochrome C oxidase subunit IV family protein n=1 Tax=Agarilytica rhodophyticola TaxID=1737490 RepID=UPI000B349C7E|nr:cytochrome C oxidase subunit IV family protein [Agarilytica rhodophyticola]
MSDESDQQHPFAIYIKIWVLLFVLSTFSYLVDFFQVQGYMRWTLVIIFMLIKAGLIMAIFMHLQWESTAVKYLLLLPPVVLLVLIGLMAIEGDYTYLSRLNFFSESNSVFTSPGNH